MGLSDPFCQVTWALVGGACNPAPETHLNPAQSCHCLDQSPLPSLGAPLVSK